MIIDEIEISNYIKTSKPNPAYVEKIIDKAQQKKGLDLPEVAALLNTTDSHLIKKIFEAASKIKLEIYGPRLVLFAPLYISNFCVNDCDYCGFHRRNTTLERKKLTLKEIREQVEILEDMGHKRLLIECGEDPVNNPIDYIVDVIKTIYSTKKGKGEIRRVNVNIAATTIENYRKLKAAGIGTYQLFQETYHKPTYEKLHHGPKADYDRQLNALDQAFKAGIDDLGMGVLFGLYHWKFEVLALVAHAQYLDKKYGVGPHTISVPRFRPAATVSFKPPYEVSDNDFLKLIAILRLAVPYTGMILSTRESPKIRAKAFKIGISQISAASSTSPGGYKKDSNNTNNNGQFSLYDHRTLDQVVCSICKQKYLPSFCTACYRSKRTGKKFMKLAKTGNIQELCQPNAILTFKEYLLDYASPKTVRVGEEIIRKTVGEIKNPQIRQELIKRLKRIERGERDIYF